MVEALICVSLVSTLLIVSLIIVCVKLFDEHGDYEKCKEKYAAADRDLDRARFLRRDLECKLEVSRKEESLLRGINNDLQARMEKIAEAATLDNDVTD